MRPVLTIDVGNTSSSVALYSRGVVRGLRRLEGGAGTASQVLSVVREVSEKTPVEGAVLSTVVPAAKRVWMSALNAAGIEGLVVDHTLNVGVTIDYPKPKTIGADRLANACAATDLFGAPVIVADFGTAVTFDVVSREGAYVGGVIAPGLPVMTDYLAERTALLPHIRLQGHCGAVGRSTEGAMRIGARIGYRGMVREIVAHLKKGMNERSVRLCATGGFSRWALQGSRMPFVFRPDLTLYGLGRIFELNRSRVASRDD